jgi:hypothetical protein
MTDTTETKVTCLVTIHGIGQQQSPDGRQDGYADTLHRLLLDDPSLGRILLPRDPLAPDAQGDNPALRPIYVVGSWPPVPNQPYGLKRLGTWADNDRRSVAVDPRVAALHFPEQYSDRPVVHLAICYAADEAQGVHPGADAETVARAAASVMRYIRLNKLLEAPFQGLVTAARTTLDRVGQHAAASPAGGLLAVLGYLDDDVALYMTNNDLRERVRSFVHDVLLRLACRADVGAIIVNAHSNGTVIAADVLRQLPPVASSQIVWFVTAGSALRKYVYLFDWGTDFFAANTDTDYIPQVQRWTNFWDPDDIVADPLAPPRSWRRGDPPKPTGPKRLFRAVAPSTAATGFIEVDDREVNNSPNVPQGGYPPHNYWENASAKGFIPGLVEIVTSVQEGSLPPRMVQLVVPPSSTSR